MILITGSTGLLGAHTLYRLLQQHDRVAALKRPAGRLDTLREIFSFYTDDIDSLMHRIEWREGDLLDRASIELALKDVDVVVNCAAIVSFNPRDRKQLIENNVEGTRNLVEAIIAKRENKVEGVDKSGGDVLFIHISSTSALGDAPGKDPDFLVDEETPRDPKRKHSGYSVSKYRSEQVVWDAIREHQLPAVILNPGIILGPGQWTKGSSQLFVKAWEGLKYYPYGGTGYVDVRDVAEVVTTFCTPPYEGGGKTTPWPPPYEGGGRYCLVGANLRYKEFFDRVTDEYGKPNPTVYAGPFLSGLAWRMDTLRARLTGRYPLITRETAEAAQRIQFYSSEKIKKALGFRFRPVEETIRWCADAYKKQ